MSTASIAKKHIIPAIKGVYNHIIKGKELPDDLSASLDNIIIIDQLFESAQKNMTIKL